MEHYVSHEYEYKKPWDLARALGLVAGDEWGEDAQVSIVMFGDATVVTIRKKA